MLDILMIELKINHILEYLHIHTFCAQEQRDSPTGYTSIPMMEKFKLISKSIYRSRINYFPHYIQLTIEATETNLSYTVL